MKELCENFKCLVEDMGDLLSPFEVKLGCGRDVFLAPLLFVIVMDCIIRNVMANGRCGLRWGMQEELKELEFTDNICLLSQKMTDIMEKL